MNDSTCPRPCLMKLDLQSSTNKLAFLKDNWPSFGQIESIDRLSETELRCTLCLLDVVLAALAKDECFCPNREIILVSRAMKEHSLLAVDDFVHLPSIYSFYFLNGILIRKICLYLWRIF